MKQIPVLVRKWQIEPCKEPVTCVSRWEALTSPCKGPACDTARGGALHGASVSQGQRQRVSELPSAAARAEQQRTKYCPQSPGSVSHGDTACHNMVRNRSSFCHCSRGEGAGGGHGEADGVNTDRGWVLLCHVRFSNKNSIRVILKTETKHSLS